MAEDMCCLPDSLPLTDYIALGAIRVRYSKSPAHHDPHRSGWIEVDSVPLEVLDDSSTAKGLNKLLAERWIRLFRSRNEPETGSLRMYLLPFDLHRSRIKRDSPALQRLLERLLEQISISPQHWSGRGVPAHEERMFDMWKTAELCSMFYMFNTLESPAPRPEQLQDKYMSRYLRYMLDANDPSGLKTVLYPYQRRAVAMMIQQELQLQRRIDPRFEKRLSMTGDLYFYDACSHVFLKSPTFFETARGGILAETMGLGKTLMCLSLMMATRGQFPSIPPEYEKPTTYEGPPSLQVLAAVATVRARMPWKNVLYEFSKDEGDDYTCCRKLMEAQSPFYDRPKGHQLIRSSRSDSASTSTERMHLSYGTIVVVPPSLVNQWETEIQKHTEEGSLDILVLKDDKLALPPVVELLKYDVLLFSQRRFANEGESKEGQYISPLSQIHWLRIIIDEGQRFTSHTMVAARVAEQVVTAERRWIVSGTPSQHLYGVEVSVDAMTSSDAESNVSNSRAEMLQEHRAFDKALETSRHGSAHSLGELLAGFLKVRPWYAAPGDSDKAASWREHAWRHEDLRKKTYSGFSAGLRDVLGSLVIKTRPEDVEKDLILPELTHTVVRLTPSPIDKMTANLFVLRYVTNAITSERRDRDYLFNPENRQHLRSLTRNLRQSAFYWPSFDPAETRKTLGISINYLEKPDIDCSDTDRALLRQTMEASNQALQSAAWSGIAKTQEMGVFLSRWPDGQRHGWLFEDCVDPAVLGLSELLQAQEHVNDQLAGDNPWSGLEELVPSTVESNRAPISQPREREMMTNVVLSEATNSDFSLKSSKKLLGGHRSKTQLQKDSRLVSVAPDSEIGSFRLLGTASSKTSYLTDKILDLHAREKILIFFDANFIAFYIKQIVELFHIKYLIYADHISQDARSKSLIQFNNEPEHRVMLMDIKSAARGLNVTAASRVFFVNPPCQPDVEAQAIKRAHRIGQTRQVHVETLILEGTVEEAIHDQARRMTDREHWSKKTLEDNTTIQSIIQNAAVIPVEEEALRSGWQMAPLRVPQQVFGRPERVPQTND